MQEGSGRILADSEYESMHSSCHPSLRGGQPPLPHCLTDAQLESLTAICDTFVPSLTYSNSNGINRSSSATHHVYSEAAVNENKRNTGECGTNLGCDEIEAFYRLSAFDLQVPAQVAGMFCAWLKPRQLFVVSLVLWLLSTRLGTFLLCGKASICKSSPFYLERFSLLPCAQREKALLNWSRSILLPRLQMLFKLLKCYILLATYTKVDKNGHNPAWGAIGYKIPHLGDHHPQTLEARELKDENISRAQQLEKKIINTQTITEIKKLQRELIDAGLSASDDQSCVYKHKIMQNYTNQAKIGLTVNCDVLVVGSGCGGSPIAATLAQQGYKVVILEKGHFYRCQSLSLLEGPSLGARYEQSGALTTKDASLIILAASTLGGGSEINWSASFRTPPHVLEEWSEKYQLKMFKTAEYQKVMDRVCQRIGVQSEVQHESFQNAVLRKGCEKLGYDCSNIPRNSGPDHFCGWCGFGCASGQKQSATQTWLQDAVAAGAVILTGCKAEAVLLSPNTEDSGPGKPLRSSGVIARLGNSTSDLICIEAKATVVACGSLSSPPLLKRSGLKNKNIGKNLHLHPTQVVWGYFPEEVDPKGKSYEGGIMTAVSKVAANWEESGYGALLETPTIHPGIYATFQPWRSGWEFKEKMRKFPRTAHFISLTRDQGGGTVDETKDGKLIIHYPISEKDKGSSIEGAIHGLRVLAAAGADMIGTCNLDGETFTPKQVQDHCSLTDNYRHNTTENIGAMADNDYSQITDNNDAVEEFLQRVRGSMFRRLNTPLASAHQMGSCRMGVDAKTSVVDPKGETWEAKGLFVGDASVFPTATGVNPMITVQSIALCIAQSVLTFLQTREYNENKGSTWREKEREESEDASVVKKKTH